jgi:hypothetical protein
MQYMILIYDDEKAWSGMDETKRNAIFQAYGQYTEDLKMAGVLRAGDALQPTSTATTVRVRGGKRLVTDGPFAETKEQFGGYYLVECKDLDEAVGWAAKCPSASYGSIEVRPVLQLSP